MAEEQQVAEEESLGKLAWGYVGVGVLWLSLVISGIALERLGLTSSVLTSVLPGEVGELRQQNTEFDANLKSVTQERDVLSRRADTFQRQLEQERNKVADLKKERDEPKSAATPPPALSAEAPETP
jgi:hypothetical protein